MSYTKKPLKSRPISKVRFKLDADAASGSDAVYLVGSFNGWDEKAMPMKKGKDGSFTLEIDLDNDASHQFRYLRSDGAWLNDPEADSYEFSEFSGVENSVIRL